MYVEETGGICRIINHSSTIKTEKLNAGGIAVSVGTAVVAREGGGGARKSSGCRISHINKRFSCRILQ